MTICSYLGMNACGLGEYSSTMSDYVTVSLGRCLQLVILANG